MAIDRRLVVGGVVVAGGGLAWWLYKKSKAASATASAPAGGYGYGYGYGYGSQQEYGYGYGSGGYGYGGFGGGIAGGVAGGGGTPPGYGYGYGGGGGGAAASTNAQWAELAASDLSAEGYSQGTVQAALGQYLMGGTLTSDQQAIVSAAIAVAGYPPQSGANGYPPAMNTSAQAGQTTGGATPPQPGGGTTPTQAGTIQNLRVTSTGKTNFTVRWNPVKNATGYSWIVRDLASHSEVSSGGGGATTATVNGLKSGTDYNFGIQALPGGIGNNVHVKTK